MLPSDGPFLGPALALLALPFRPVTAGDFTSSPLGQKTGVCIMPGARWDPPVKLVD
jgi:hypothetical protein